MYVLVLIMTIGTGFVNVKAVNHIYPTMNDCKEAARYLRSDLMSARPTPNSNVHAYCTEIPVEV
tara:strand:+ start:1538 stop:1729 length:192 start_codon:yes stop_codon:yes gene_type:complete